MELAVRFKKVNSNNLPMTIIVSIDDNITDEDRMHDVCDDFITECIGEHPKWIRIEGEVEVKPLNPS